MLRLAFSAVLVVLLGIGPVHAQQTSWAEKMFEETQHDFGTVARGSTAEYYFQFKNIYKPDIHIAGVKSSCGCTEPRVTKSTIGSLESAAVVARLNTHAFIGNKSAVLTVIIDKPYYAEVPLYVKGYIRSDLTLSPEGVTFGPVYQGHEATKEIDITYNGYAPWEIKAIKIGNKHVSAEAVESKRGSGQVSYKMTVKIDKETPIGLLKESIVVVTNDKSSPNFTVDVEAEVLPEILVKPSNLFMGVLKPGETVTKQILIRAQSDFTLLGVECDDQNFSFRETVSSPKKIHLIPVTYTAPAKSGLQETKIRIRIDHNEEMVADVKAQAQITD